MENKAELGQDRNNKGKLFNDELVQHIQGVVLLYILGPLILMYLNFVGFLLE